MANTLIMGVSADGYISKGPGDDLKWLGKSDKQIFRLLSTVLNKGYCIAGTTTFNELPPLKNRIVHQLTNDQSMHVWKYNLRSLIEAHQYGDSGYNVLGGQQTAVSFLSAKILDEAIICRSPERCFKEDEQPTPEAVKWILDPMLFDYFGTPILMTVGDIKIEYYTRYNND